MSREVRRVPQNWKHPKRQDGRYEPLFDSAGVDFSDSDIDRADYIPDWIDSLRTHFQLYETTSEGTPITPPCATEEELARFCSDNKISTFGTMTTNYEQWLAMIQAGSSVASFTVNNGEIVSGVDEVSAQA